MRHFELAFTWANESIGGMGYLERPAKLRFARRHVILNVSPQSTINKYDAISIYNSDRTECRMTWKHSISIHSNTGYIFRVTTIVGTQYTRNNSITREKLSRSAQRKVRGVRVLYTVYTIVLLYHKWYCMSLLVSSRTTRDMNVYYNFRSVFCLLCIHLGLRRLEHPRSSESIISFLLHMMNHKFPFHATPTCPH